MSNYAGLIAEVNAKATIPDKQLEAIMTAYPTYWGYAAPTSDKQGKKKLLMAATKLPEGWSAKDIQDMKSQIEGGMPEMIEIFGKAPADMADVCMQPFPLLENDKGGTTLSLFMEGDFGHWANENEPTLSPEYICYRDKISPLISKLETLCGGDVNRLIKELEDPVYQDILEGTFENRGVMYFVADTGHSTMVEGGNEHRKDEDWGATSNEVPEIQVHTDTTVEEVIEAPPAELTLAEKRALRQKNANKAAAATAADVKNPTGVHATTSKPVSLQKDTTLAEQGIKDSLKGSTTASTPKGPKLINLPSTVRTVEDALQWWKTNFGTCPNEWKVKQADNTWLPSYTAGFPFEKAAKNSSVREKYNPDGSPKSSGKGFAALDNLATGATTAATTKAADPDAPRSAPPPVKLPIIPTAVRDKVLEEMHKLDVKGRKVQSSDEIKAVETKHSTFFQQLAQIPVEDFWKMSYAELDRLNRTYPDFGSVWLFSLRNYQIQNWKPAGKPQEKEQTTEAAQPEQELTLAQKRALRKKAAA